MLVLDGIARRQSHRPRFTIHLDSGCLGTKLDFMISEELCGPKRDHGNRVGSPIQLRQRRPLVGKVCFVAEQRDPTVEAAQPQRDRDLHPAVPSADDDDAPTLTHANRHPRPALA
jgi:hypothetical protein